MPSEPAPPSIIWSEWSPIEAAASKRGPFPYFGIYQIRAVKASGEPIPIPRIAGTDASGTLYFGRSGFGAQGTDRFVSNRIREFKNHQHSGGQTYFICSIVLHGNAAFEGHLLQVRACQLQDDEIERAEDLVLTQYLMEYGELPPCNSVMPKLKRALF